MERQEFEVLVARVEKLERRVRVVVAGWVLSVTAFVILGVAVQQATSQPEVLRARHIMVVDAAGRPRIALSVTPDGSSVLGFRDAAGQVRIGLLVLPNGSPALEFRDAAGRPRIGLSAAPDGTSVLDLRDAAGRVRIMLGLTRDGEPLLGLYDAARRRLFAAP